MSVKQETSRVEKVIKGVALAFLGYLVVIMSRSLWDIKQAYKRIDTAEYRLEQEQAKHQELLNKLKEATGSAYVERVARDELNMQKEGETIVLVPGNSGEKEDKAVITDKEKEMRIRRNWEKWWDLLR